MASFGRVTLEREGVEAQQYQLMAHFTGGKTLNKAFKL
jgi:hypothetical protein